MEMRRRRKTKTNTINPVVNISIVIATSLHPTARAGRHALQIEVDYVTVPA